MMHGDSRVMVVVCLETASLPAPCLSTSTSPRSREEPIKRKPPSRDGGFFIAQTRISILLPREALADVGAAGADCAAVSSSFSADSPSWVCCFLARLATISAEPNDAFAELEISIVYLLPRDYRPGPVRHEPYRSTQICLVRRAPGQPALFHLQQCLIGLFSMLRATEQISLPIQMYVGQ